MLAGQEGFTWHWLISTQFQHWDLAMHAAYSLQHRLFFFDYRWALVAMLAFLGASIYLLERILAMLVLRRWITILLALWFGLNVLWIRPLQWWAAGVQYFPYTFFDLLCLYGFLRYHVSGSSRWVAVSGGALVIGLLFYEKSAYMLIYLLLLRVLLMTSDLRPRVVLAELWREHSIWIAYLLVTSAWAIGYIHSGAYSGSSLGNVTFSQYMSYFKILWLQTLIPSIASVTIPATKLDTLQVLFVVVSQLAVAGGVLVSVRRKRSAWRAWAFIVIIVFVSGGLVARSRITQFGVGIANDPRYLVDFAWLVPLTVCAAFARGKILTPRLAEREVPLTMPSFRSAARLLVGMVVIGYAGGSVATAMQLQRDWPGSESRAWEQHLRSGFAELRRTSTPFVVADNATPFEIMEPFVSPYNRLSRVLNMYVGPVQVDGPLNGVLYTVALNGSLHRAKAEATEGSGVFGDLVRSHQVRFGGGREVRRGDEVCVIADGAAVQFERPLPVPPTVGDAPYYLLLQGRVWRSVALPVFADTGSGYPGSTTYSIALQPGTATSIAWLGPEAPRGVLLTIPALTTVCFARFEVVTLRDAS